MSMGVSKYQYFDVEGVPVRVEVGSYESAVACDTSPPRPFPPSAVFHKGVPITEAEFRATSS
jgi:hypothetical protein